MGRASDVIPRLMERFGRNRNAYGGEAHVGPRQCERFTVTQKYDKYTYSGSGQKWLTGYHWLVGGGNMPTASWQDSGEEKRWKTDYTVKTVTGRCVKMAKPVSAVECYECRFD